jgi:hypothetical protein
MGQPTQTDVHVDSILTAFSLAYIQDTSNFIAPQVFPVVQVDKQSDLYFVYNKGDWFRDEAEKRADLTESAGSGYTLSTDKYYADVWALHKDIGDQTRKNEDDPLDADRDAALWLTQRMLIRQEKQFLDDYFKTGVWATDKVGGSDFTQWSDFAGSDPMEDVAGGKELVLGTTGKDPNTLVLGYPVYRKLKNHPDIVDRIKFTSSNVVTTDLLAKYFEVDRVLVSKAVSNTGKEGQANNFSFMAGKSAWLGYVDPGAGLRDATAGKIFMWDGVSDGLGNNIGITKIRMPLVRGDRIESQIAWDNKVIAADLGYFFGSAVA